jgi:hypothetical protein
VSVSAEENFLGRANKLSPFSVPSGQLVSVFDYFFLSSSRGIIKEQVQDDINVSN